MKTRFDRAQAITVAKEMCDALKPVCSRIIVAGSLRRRKPTVGDVEIVYIPLLETRQVDFFSSAEFNLADERIDSLVTAGRIGKRQNVDGHFTWGPKNKLACHLPTGIPVDLFAATESNWWNYVVCRTGPAESNVRIAASAQARGWKWNPYGPGFSRGGPLAGPEEIHVVSSEADVFEFVGLPYLQPWERL